jgi:hypothetical protein
LELGTLALPLAGLLLMLLLVLIFGSYLLNLLILFQDEPFKIQIMMQQGYQSLQMDKIWQNKDLDNRKHLVSK